MSFFALSLDFVDYTQNFQGSSNLALEAVAMFLF